MALWGKVICGGIGAVIGGPIGAGIGVALGHRFDKGAGRASLQEQITAAYMFTLVGSMAKMAKADGVVCKKEVDTIGQIFNKLGLKGDGLEAVKQIFNSVKTSDTPIQDYLNQYFKIINRDPQMAQGLYYTLLELAKSDGNIHDSEKEILIIAERCLQLAPGTTESILGSSDGMSKEAAAKILEIQSTASQDEIKAAYRTKCKEMHPDKLGHKGLPQELMEYANAQMSRYSDARDVLLN